MHMERVDGLMTCSEFLVMMAVKLEKSLNYILKCWV